MDNSFKNDMSDFFMKEYENIAQAYFNSHELAAKWMKFYLIILAVPFSFIAFIFSKKPEQLDLLNLPNTISILIFVVGIINTVLSFLIIHSRMDTTLYARTINGIRKYFYDHNKDRIENLKQYIILPIDATKPHFLRYRGDRFLLLILTSFVNSLYLGYGFSQIKILQDEISYLWGMVIFIVSILMHFLYYIYAAKRLESRYGTENNNI